MPANDGDVLMLKKFLVGVVMSAVFIASIIAAVLVPILATIYAGEHYGPHAAAGTLFVSLCVVCGALSAVFD